MQNPRLNIYIWIIIIFIATTSCLNKDSILYQSPQFTVYADKVVQGEYKATAISDTRLVSDYQSMVNANYSRLIKFKFSINEKDNEMRSGIDHWIIVGSEHESPVVQFGQNDGVAPVDDGTKLPANYKYTFQVDMSAVLKQFEENGYYEAFDGSRIAKSDFKAIYIAGGAEPLTWDFSSLEENQLELKDIDNDGIYKITLILNPLKTDQKKANEWILSSNLAAKPRYNSDQKIVDALFNLSLEEARLNIEADSTFRTGAKWGGVWTRDVSYSIILAFAYLEPEIAKTSLMKKVKRDRIIQDTGSGGAWPVSSDRTTWCLAAWEIYKVTGDDQWLKKVYPIIKNTLEDDFKTLKSEKTGMYCGESSFLDWREQTYPKWMTNADIYMSENLGTNVVHYQAHVILSEMAQILGEPVELYLNRASQIKKAINKQLWMEDKGYYGQYLYGRTNLNISPRFEALGEALSVLYDVADSTQVKSIIEKSPVTAYGVTCIYPQITGIPPYHNNAIWPFVQSYWNLAAAKAGNEKVLNHGLAALYRAGALFLTNYENFVAETGDYEGTEINSHRMLWSMAGNLAMVHRVFIGMNFETNGIQFHPVIPKGYTGTKSLANYKYRKSVLNISVKGYGNKISSIKLDGKPLQNAFLAASVSGKHNIEIIMADNDFSSGNINLVENRFALQTPQMKIIDSTLSWAKIPGAVSYQVFKNGNLLGNVNSNFAEIEPAEFAEYRVVAMDETGTASFGSEPVIQYSKSAEVLLEVEDYLQRSKLPYSNFSGSGFVETSVTKNQKIPILFNVDSPGEYRIDVRYSNGTGPWNTDNNCGIRSLYVNNEYKGVLVFPQRGTDEWSDWGFSNTREIELNKRKNTIEINFEDWNINMDGEVNEAMLDYIRLIKVN